MSLTPEQEKYFEEMDALFKSKGWEELMNDLAARYEQLTSAILTQSISSDADLREFIGASKVIKSMLDYEKEVKTAEELATNPPDAEEEDA